MVNLNGWGEMGDALVKVRRDRRERYSILWTRVNNVSMRLWHVEPRGWSSKSRLTRDPYGSLSVPSLFIILPFSPWTLIHRLSLFMSPIQDRTNEFRSCVESIRSRSSLPRGADAKQRLLRNGKTPTKSEFTRMASTIGKDISSTTIKLGKLAQRRYYSAVSYSATYTYYSRKTENIVRRPTC